MDPLTQGIVGTTAVHACSKKRNIILAGFIGFLSGMAPDIDIFIRSGSDPLLFLEYHRQFTHSLIFIPVGGFVCALIFYYSFTKRMNLSFKNTYIFSTIGYGTHGIIDTCTTYGTQLYWPFSNERLAWNTISVIDPLFTIPVIILCILTIAKKNKTFSYYALAWMFIYQGIAFNQKHRAEDIIYEYALSQGHNVQTIEAKPSFGNIVVWKVIYTDNKYFYVNAVRLGISNSIIKGERIKKLIISEDFPWLFMDSQQAKDLERFKWFSNEYLAVDEGDKNIIYDIRFSAIPNETEGLWGIRLDPNKPHNKHIEYITNRKKNIGRYPELIKMILNYVD
tara:strand:+ start:6657 stop:7664 length:1008 start_codon:yes stop_codon:yes gene_type:complete